MNKLALLGGSKAKTVPFGSGERFGEPELQQLREALAQQTLFYWKGTKVKTLTEKFAALYGSPYCVAASSGTAAIHVALGALGITEGDEVITAPITDMGSVIGILYQNAIPIFADLDPHTYNMTAASIAARITDKTKAILVVHLAGNAADMDPIMDLAQRHGIKVIEDCAQSYQCFYKGRLAGTIGDIGCFSLNDFKHISAGDGGMLLMRDKSLYERAFRFADKNYNRFPHLPDTARDIASLAPNYRMNELTGAVGIAQLDRLDTICKRRNWYGDALTRAICDLPGLYPPRVLPGGRSSYWFYMLRIDVKEAGVTRGDFCAALQAEGVPCDAGYIPCCVYEYPLFRDLSAYPGTHSPFDSPYYNREIRYDSGLCPIAEQILATAVRLPVSEFFTEQDLAEVISAIRKVAAYYQKQKE
jgi:dTDP-4-amino-4,6-dideoxygalactose transaminase